MPYDATNKPLIPTDVVGARCPRCDYDLRGLTRNICPECGTPFDPRNLARPEPIWRRTLRGVRKCGQRHPRLRFFVLAMAAILLLVTLQKKGGCLMPNTAF